MSEQHVESAEFQEMARSNTWHESNVVVAAQEILDLVHSKEWLWFRNTHCKYVNIRIDMRDGGFLLMDRNHGRVSLDAIKWQYSKGKESE